MASSPEASAAAQAAGHLRRHHAGLLADEAQAGELVEALPHAEQGVAVGHRQHAPVGRLPVHLLADLVGEGLVAVHAVGVAAYGRPEVGRGRIPAPLGHPGLQELPTVGLGAGGYYHGAVGLHLGDDGGGGALDGEHDAGQPGAGGVGRGRGAGIAGGADPHRPGAEARRHGDGGERQPVLEGARRILRFVLQEQPLDPDPAPVALAVEQRRLPLAQGGGVLDVRGQQLAVAPHAGGPAVQRLDGQRLRGGVEVVARREVGRGFGAAFRAPIETGFDAEGCNAADAGETGEVAHVRVTLRRL